MTSPDTVSPETTARGNRREGWYADPLGEADLRWWDGQNWTTQVTAIRSGNSRANTAARPASLQWAEDEPRRTEPTGNTNRNFPAPAPRLDEPKLALGTNAASENGEPDSTAPASPDWSPLALALLNAGDNIVTATAATIPTITIDMAEGTYWWERSLDSFVAHPEDLVVHTIPRERASTPAVAGRYTEALLWRIGTGADTLFNRVDPALRYKLRRWPDLSAMPHTVEQGRAIELLATAQLTTTELSAIANIPERKVRTLIGTFGLMSLIDAVKDPAAGRS